MVAVPKDVDVLIKIASQYMGNISKVSKAVKKDARIKAAGFTKAFTARLGKDEKSFFSGIFSAKEVMEPEQFKAFEKRLFALRGPIQKGVIKPMQGIGVATRQSGKDMLDFKRENLSNFRALRATLGASTMAFLFFGMAVQRVLTSIWRSSTKVFQDAMHSVDGTVTGFDQLNGSASYLGFVIGQALEPIATWLAPIIMKFADWVSENEGLARTVFTVGAALAFVLVVGGQLGLTFIGIASLVNALGILQTKWAAKKAAAEVGAAAVTKKAWIASAFASSKAWLGAFALKAKALLILIAPWALLAAVIYSVIRIWGNLVTAFKLRIEQLVNRFKLFWLFLKLGFENLGDIFKAVGVGMKIAWAKMINWVITKLESAINGAVRIYNAARKAFGLQPISFKADLSSWKQSTDHLYADLDKINNRMAESEARFLVEADPILTELDRIKYALEINLRDADKKMREAWDFKKIWADAKPFEDMKEYDEINKDFFRLEANAPTEIINYNSFDINITPIMEGESQSDYFNRVAQQIQDAIARTS